jgi:hypothetical protein
MEIIELKPRYPRLSIAFTLQPFSKIFDFANLGVYLHWKQAEGYSSPRILAHHLPPISLNINPKFSDSQDW